jgi:hypothetical protein
MKELERHVFESITMKVTGRVDSDEMTAEVLPFVIGMVGSPKTARVALAQISSAPHGGDYRLGLDDWGPEGINCVADLGR